MLVIIVMAIAFFMYGTTFGAGLLAAFGAAQVLYWIFTVFVSIIAILIFCVATLGGASIGSDYNKSSMIGGGILGGFAGGLVGAFMVAVASVQLWLTYYIIDNVPVAAQSFADLPANTTYAIITFFTILILGMLGNSSNKNSSN